MGTSPQTAVEILECSTCHQILPVQDFYRAKGTFRGYQYPCKTCRKAYCRSYYQRGQSTTKRSKGNFNAPPAAPAAQRRALAGANQRLRDVTVDCRGCQQPFVARLRGMTVPLWCPRCIRERVAAVLAVREPDP